MKPSYYNIATPAANGEDTVLYNTLSGAMTLLTHDEYEQYRAFEDDCFESDASSLRKVLADEGFLLDDPDFEVELMRYQFEQTKFNSRVFELYVMPTLDCNFSCVYCYEGKRHGRMTVEVQDALVRFVKDQYREAPYKELKIVWYGGEPLLCVDIIERLSEFFISFCDEKGIEYYASVISNMSLATEDMQKRLERCRVWCMMATLDGIGETHERTRRSCNGKPSYDLITEHIEGCVEKGMCIDLRCVVCKDNLASCLELSSKFSKMNNVGIRFNQMRDMTNFRERCPPDEVPVILSSEAHARAVYDQFMQLNPTASDFNRMLRPLPVHCSTSVDREYNIDELGNAYACSSVVGMDEYVLFNIVEPPEQRSINQKLIARYGNQNPFDCEQCRSCSVLPLCKGGCTRERMEDKITCSPIKYIIKDLITAYSAVV